MKIRALGNKVITRQLKSPGVSAGGIILAGRKDEFEGENLVTSVGPKVKDIQVGDIVLLNKGSGEFWKDGDFYYNRNSEDQVIAIEHRPEKK